MFQNNCQAGRDKARQVIFPENYSYGTSPELPFVAHGQLLDSLAYRSLAWNQPQHMLKGPRQSGGGGGGGEPRKEKQTSGLPEKGR